MRQMKCRDRVVKVKEHYDKGFMCDSFSQNFDIFLFQ